MLEAPGLSVAHVCVWLVCSTLMRRVPDPDGARWNHMALYLQPREKEPTGVWMEDFKFLAAYKLRSSVSCCTDVSCVRTV